MSRTVAIWDIDGTLANHSHRSALLEKKCAVCLYSPMPVAHHSFCPSCGNTSSITSQESWDAFLQPDLMALDTPIPAAIDLLNRLRELNAEIHFITGRVRSTTGQVTEEWLQFKAGRQAHELLYMREAGDEGLPASKYKARAVGRLKEKIGTKGVFIFFEDDPHVFPVYNQHGIVVRCPEGLSHFMPAGTMRIEQAWQI